MEEKKALNVEEKKALNVEENKALNVEENKALNVEENKALNVEENLIKRFSTLLAIILFNGGLFIIEIEKLSFCMIMASKRNFN